MFASAYQKDKQIVNTVGEAIEYLKKYPVETPMEGQFSSGVVLLVHENCEDPEDISITFEDLDMDDMDETDGG